MQSRAKKGAIRDFIASMRAKQFAWISNDFQMSVIKIVISILMMIINIIISHYHNITSKKNTRGNLIIAPVTWKVTIQSFAVLPTKYFFFILVLFFWFGIVIKWKETHAGHAAFKKNDEARALFKYSFVKMVDTSLALFKRMQAMRLEMRHLKNSLNPAGDHAYLYPFGN